jgi:hypothetical protein
MDASLGDVRADSAAPGVTRVRTAKDKAAHALPVPVSGGVSMRSLMPHAATPVWRALEKSLEPLDASLPADKVNLLLDALGGNDGNLCIRSLTALVSLPLEGPERRKLTADRYLLLARM